MKQVKYRVFCYMGAGDEEVNVRNSCSLMFCKTGFLKTFANFTGKDLWWTLFLIMLQA